MAYANKYLIEFKDIYGPEWKIDIQEDGFEGNVTTLTATESPLTIEYNNDSDDYNDPIRPSKARINVYSTSDFALTDFYTDEDFRLKVIISCGANTYWQGFVTSGEYSEPYEQTPYPVTINAIDGLTYLKSFPYASSVSVSGGYKTTTYYQDRKTFSAIIWDILNKIQITTFTEFINIYEAQMTLASTETVDHSPLDQTIVDADLFKGMTCYEVLAELLRTWNAVIRQNTSGQMVIFRPEEMTGATAYGRVFTSATAKSSTTLTPEQNISRATSTTIRQVPGGALMIQRPIKNLTLLQDYGNKQSWIDSWEFTREQWVRRTGFRSWSEAGAGGSSNVNWAGNLLIGEKEGMYFQAYNSYPGTMTKYLYQSFGDYATASDQVTGDIFTFEFDYAWFSEEASTVNSVVLYLEVTQGSYYLVASAGDYLEWSLTPDYISITENVEPGITDFTHVKKLFVGLPGAGSLTVKIFALDDSIGDVYSIIKRVQLYCASGTTQAVVADSTGLVSVSTSVFPSILLGMGPGSIPNLSHIKVTGISEVLTQEYSVNNSSVSFGRDQELSYLIGDATTTDTSLDNVIEQYAGSLSVSLATLTDAATTFDSTHSAAYASGGVTVTTDGVDIIFTSSAAGTDFTGSTTITNVTGDLSGTVVNTTANVVLQEAWANDTPYVVDDRCSDGGNNYICIQNNTNQQPSSSPSYWTQTAPPAARVDTITLSGSVGSANILCDGVTRSVSIGQQNTSSWHTRGGGENDPIVELIGGEIGDQYSRPKQLLQLSLQETDTTAPVLKTVGLLKDSLNTVGGNARQFVMNRGEFDVKLRKWDADFIEMI